MSDDQTGREECYFCGYRPPGSLESHHIIPKREGGPDHPDNLVDVCSRCHDKLEALYDDFVWRFVGDAGRRLMETHVRKCPHCEQSLILNGGECIKCDNFVDLADVDYRSLSRSRGVRADAE